MSERESDSKSNIAGVIFILILLVDYGTDPADLASVSNNFT
jgi:hypothetical protein